MPEAVRRHADVLAGRTMFVKRLSMFPVECVARGWLTGSGWKDYGRTGAVCGHRLPPDLPESTRLDPPLFTPATKAEEGHDENIDFDRMSEIVGAPVAERLRDLTIEVYETARNLAAERGIIIADTKFEFGQDAQGRIVLGDEVLTPDSSRFWDAESYAPGRSQQPLDKQLVRNWLDEQGWDHSPPAPVLSDDVVSRTSGTYREIYKRLTGRELDG
jgi:phosphoribosylaminoimidazole-succinocarboxamide synthase